MEGLAEEEVDRYLEEKPKLVQLFKIDVVELVTLYMADKDMEREEELREPDSKAVAELHYAQEALERGMERSQRVKASTLEEVNLGSILEPRALQVAKEMMPKAKDAMVEPLTEYKDIFV